MSETLTIPVPGTEKPADTQAPEVKALDAGKELAPPADKPAGKDEQPTALKPDGEVPEKPEDDAESRRKARNRERWQAMKAEREGAIRRAERAEAELTKIRGAKRDYSQISDPGEELAARTADMLRSQQAEDFGEAAKQERQRATAAMHEAWELQRAEMREKYPDFEERFSRVPLHARAAPFIVESDNGGEIANWLANNPEAAHRLANQFETEPARALIELGKIEAKITAPEPKRVSSAPKPAVTLAGGSSPLGFDPKSASVDDFAAQLRKAKLIR